MHSPRRGRRGRIAARTSSSNGRGQQRGTRCGTVTTRAGPRRCPALTQQPCGGLQRRSAPEVAEETGPGSRLRSGRTDFDALLSGLSLCCRKGFEHHSLVRQVLLLHECYYRRRSRCPASESQYTCTGSMARTRALATITLVDTDALVDTVSITLVDNDTVSITLVDTVSITLVDTVSSTLVDTVSITLVYTVSTLVDTDGCLSDTDARACVSAHDRRE